MTDKLRMEAYYYGFDRTGVAEIDKILSAVAWAGTSFHLTEDWCDNAHARPPHTGQTPIEWIQNAACEAAGKWKERVGNWQPIDTAPKDGTPIDVWCVPPEDSEFKPEKGGIRLTDVWWHEAEEIFPHTGWVRACDDGNWDLVEGDISGKSESLLPPWIPTHWMPLPEGPKEKL